MSRIARVEVEVRPGHAAINQRFEIAWSPKRPSHRPRLATSRRYKNAKSAIAEAARLVALQVGRFDEGELACAIVTYWPRRSHKLGDLPRFVAEGDVDATTKVVLDGLQAGGLIDTDARVVELHQRKMYDKDRPRVLVSVWQREDGQ
jgi:Holliday junction resolvase RusA-like endonuclease